jgi:ribosomal protein S19
MQVTGNELISKDETSVGFDLRMYSRVALCLVAAYVEKKRPDWLDYKCHACWTDDSHIYPESSSGNIQGGLWKSIREWVRISMKDFTAFLVKESGKVRVFRRSLAVSFTTSFLEGSVTEASGHAITIGMECIGLCVRLFVFDFRVEEYVYNVHDLILVCMAESVRASQLNVLCKAKGAGLDVRTEIVGLKHMVHYGNDFMMCMSISYRVCMYLSFVKDCVSFKETGEDFKRDSAGYKHHIFRMINWLHHNEEIREKRAVPIVAPRMADLVFEVNNGNCYFLLVPVKSLKSLVKIPRIYLWIAQARATARLHFDLDGREAFRVEV